MIPEVEEDTKIEEEEVVEATREGVGEVTAEVVEEEDMVTVEEADIPEEVVVAIRVEEEEEVKLVLLLSIKCVIRTVQMSYHLNHCPSSAISKIQYENVLSKLLY